MYFESALPIASFSKRFLVHYAIRIARASAWRAAMHQVETLCVAGQLFFRFLNLYFYSLLEIAVLWCILKFYVEEQSRVASS